MIWEGKGASLIMKEWCYRCLVLSQVIRDLFIYFCKVNLESIGS